MATPNLNLSRPKVARNRWRRWMARTPFVGDVLRAQWVVCALRNCDAGRNDQDARIYRAEAISQILSFEMTYAG